MTSFTNFLAAFMLALNSGGIVWSLTFIIGFKLILVLLVIATFTWAYYRISEVLKQMEQYDI